MRRNQFILLIGKIGTYSFFNDISVYTMILGYMNIKFLLNYAIYVFMLGHNSKYLDLHMMYKGELFTQRNTLIIYNACLRQVAGKAVKRSYCLLSQDLLYPLVYFIMKCLCAQNIRVKKKIHISKCVCQLVKGHPLPNKSQIKTIMQPLVGGRLIELYCSAGQKGVYSSKTTLSPSDWAYRDGFRMPSSHLALGFVIFVFLLLTFTQQGTLDSDLPLQGFVDTFLLLSYLPLATLCNTLLLQELSLAHSYLWFFVWYFDNVTNIYVVSIICQVINAEDTMMNKTQSLLNGNDCLVGVTSNYTGNHNTVS